MKNSHSYQAAVVLPPVPKYGNLLPCQWKNYVKMRQNIKEK